MTESYEGNGEYNNYNDEETDFKRKVGSGGGSQNENSEEPHNEQPSLNDKANDYIRDCLMEKNKLDKNFPIAERLLEGGNCMGPRRPCEFAFSIHVLLSKMASRRAENRSPVGEGSVRWRPAAILYWMPATVYFD